MPMMHSPRRSECGFTVVEVLIGLVITSIVFGGAIYFFAGAGKAQQRSQVREKMAAAADSINQRVRATRTWATGACTTNFATGCDATSQFALDPPKQGEPKFTAKVHIIPVDSKGDGLGAADLDHIRPDFYRFEVTIALAQGEATKWGEAKDFETVSSVDASAIGRATGSLVIQTCGVTNQVDERMSIEGCGSGGDLHDMSKQPEPCQTPADWTAIQVYGCNSAFTAAVNSNRMFGAVNVNAVCNVPFTISRDTSDGQPGAARTSGDADGGCSGGTYVFSGLPAGGYKITASPGAGREVWGTHNIPDVGSMSVQSNQQARGLVMVRPKQGLGQYRIKVDRTVFLYKLHTRVNPIVTTENVDGWITRTTTTYTYLYASAPERLTWGGPAWTGRLGMEPKPFDRYRAASSPKNAWQLASTLVWKNANIDPWVTIPMMPTGLASLPTQVMSPAPPPDDYWGSLGDRTVHHSCPPGGSGGCNDFTWFSTSGAPNGYTTFHSDDGECMLESDTSDFAYPRQLAEGGGHGNRCSRDWSFRGAVIKDFLPDKSGGDGKTITLHVTQTSVVIGFPPGGSCVGGCSATSDTDPGVSEAASTNPDYSSGPNVGASSGPPPTANQPPPRVAVKQAPPPTPAPAPLSPPSGGGGCSICGSPPPASGGGGFMPAAAAMPSTNG